MAVFASRLGEVGMDGDRKKTASIRNIDQQFRFASYTDVNVMGVIQRAMQYH